MSLENLIKQKITSQIESAQIIIENEGDGYHFDIIVISPVFEEKKLLERQRLVMGAIKGLFNEDLHAVSIKTYTLEMWKGNNAS